MAKTSITPALAAKYPEFANRVGETVDASEIRRVKSDFDVNGSDAKKAATRKVASAPAAPKVASRKRAPAKKAAKKATS